MKLGCTTVFDLQHTLFRFGHTQWASSLQLHSSKSRYWAKWLWMATKIENENNSARQTADMRFL
jgi:hypothetical protein